MDYETSLLPKVFPNKEVVYIPQKQQKNFKRAKITQATQIKYGIRRLCA